MSPAPSPAPAAAPLLVLLALAAARGAAAADFQLTNVVLLRVGDGTGSSLTARAAPVYLDEVYPAYAAAQGRVSSRLVAGATLPANDFTMGTAQLSADGAFATFGAIAAPVNSTSPTPCTAAGSCFPGVARVLARVAWDGSVSTATTVDPASWSGLIKGACSVDGSSYFVVGNSSTIGLGWKAHGSGTAPLISQYAAASQFVSCAVGATSKSLYIVRTTGTFGEL